MTSADHEVRCACPRHDAGDCYRFRYGHDLRGMLGDDLPRGAEDEACDCACHDGNTNDGWDDEPEPTSERSRAEPHALLAEFV